MITNMVRLFLFRKRWRKGNLHNETCVANQFDMSRVTVGKGTYGKIRASFFGAENEALRIGNWCSIGGGVHFLCGGDHE